MQLYRPDAMFGLAVMKCSYAGLMLSLGAEGALGFVVSHELVHGKSKVDHGLAHLMLCTTGYMHWSISHIAHHAQASTTAFRHQPYVQLPGAQTPHLNRCSSMCKPCAAV